MSIDQADNFYCSQKFTGLSVDLEKKLAYSCCAARPEKLNMDWLASNPGQLFNTEIIQHDRQLMLDNLPAPSCQDACWIPESKNLISRRLAKKSYIPIKTDISVSTPSDLNIMVGSTCNLTCSYCCKQYSSAWRRDIELNGPYLDHDRFNITSFDKVLLKLSQPELQNSSQYQLLFEQIKLLGPVETIYITGGEPFLYNSLLDLLDNLSNDSKIIIQTGLGVDPKRFANQIDKIKGRSNIQIRVSAEGVDKFYEFNRYGNSYNNFLENLRTLESNGFNPEFLAVLSNLTIFGLLEFTEKFIDYKIEYQYCNEPDFLSVNVLDDTSKMELISSISDSRLEIKEDLISAIQQSTNLSQKNNLEKYLSKFVSNRNLDIDIFPKSFLSWINLNKGHINVVQ